GRGGRGGAPGNRRRRRAGLARHAVSASVQREGRGGGLPRPGAGGVARGYGRRAGGAAALSPRLGRGRGRGGAVGGGAALAGGDIARAGGAGRRAAVPHGGGRAGQTLRGVERGGGARVADDPR